MASILTRMPSPPLMVVNGRKPISGMPQRFAFPAARDINYICQSYSCVCIGTEASYLMSSRETRSLWSGSKGHRRKLRIFDIWDNSEDRVALIGLGFAGVVGFWAAVNIVTAIDKLPVVPSLLELIGLLFASSGLSGLIENMAWFSGKVSLGNLDFAGAVNKLSESVKNIEKNFDSALGIEEKSDADAAAAASDSEAHCDWQSINSASFCITASGIWPSATDENALFEPTAGLMGQRGGKDTVESPDMPVALDPTSSIKDKQVEDENSVNQKSEVIPGGEGVKEELRDTEVETGSKGKIKDTSEEAEENAASDHSEAVVVSPPIPVEAFEQKSEEVQHTESTSNLQEEERLEEVIPKLSETVQPGSTDNLQEKGSEIISSTLLESLQPESISSGDTVGDSSSLSNIGDATSLSKSIDDENAKTDVDDGLPDQTQDASLQGPNESRESHVSDVPVSTTEAEDSCADNRSSLEYNKVEASKAASDLVTPLTDAVSDSVDQKQHLGKYVKERMSSASNSSNIADSVAEHEKVMKEMKMMEAALHGAARQAQAKAEEIARLMNENEGNCKVDE
ncbi:hypothetical protein SASPL_123186 [Salvia splendens]|uniref:Cyanobacterial aminoacyl-tRNA synthetase CAAD domain-containing protein n=1 Tax=Salvia splendens TaxID=180675 RepID=A0A8X8ZTQ6_SALSN|nr:hypothetical protein SASPL_123186 [Salvia splendens]